MLIRAHSYCYLEDLEDGMKQRNFTLDYHLQHMDIKERVR